MPKKSKKKAKEYKIKLKPMHHQDVGYNMVFGADGVLRKVK